MASTWPRWLRDTATRQSPPHVALGVLAFGLLLGAGAVLFDRLAPVSVLYVVLGSGLVVTTRRTPGWVTGPRAVGLVAAGVGASFAYLLGDVLLARLTYNELTVGLVADGVVVSMRRWLSTLAVGGLFLLGVASRPRERELASLAVVSSLVVVFWLEVLGRYAGVFWPVLPLFRFVALLVGVVLAGGPLYLVGVAVRPLENPDSREAE